MSNFIPVGSQHVGRHWRRANDFEHARGETMVPVALSELPELISRFPVAFSRCNGVVMPVAVLSLDGKAPLFVDANGRWRAPYVPSLLRSYPFELRSVEQPAVGKLALCVDEAAVVPEGQDGEDFFVARDTPSPALNRMMDFLRAVHQQLHLARLAAAALDAQSLLIPITTLSKTFAGFSGLLQVDANALQAVSGDRLKVLQDSHALSLAYAQVFSQSQMSTLTRRMASVSPSSASTTAAPTIDALFSEASNDTISFEGFQ